MKLPAQPADRSQEFQKNFTNAILSWQYVENSLFAVLCAFFDAPVNVQCSAVFYSQDSFGAKLKVVSAVAKVSLAGSRLEAWQAIEKRLKAAAGERNVLAHHTAVAEFFPDASFGIVLAPPLMAPAQLRRARSRKYDAEGCAALGKLFIECARDLRDFIAEEQ